MCLVTFAPSFRLLLPHDLSSIIQPVPRQLWRGLYFFTWPSLSQWCSALGPSLSSRCTSTYGHTVTYIPPCGCFVPSGTAENATGAMAPLAVAITALLRGWTDRL